jgi:hypothetical protein
LLKLKRYLTSTYFFIGFLIIFCFYRSSQLLYQRTFLRDERRRLRISSEQIEEKEKHLKLMRRNDYLPESIQKTLLEKKEKEKEEKHLLLNIGGLMFEAPYSILQRDKSSLLSQLCGPEPPLMADAEGGFFFFDRDWWLFRYLLLFLRDGILPDDRKLLAQLYREASFWNLKQMQKAIEETKVRNVCCCVVLVASWLILSSLCSFSSLFPLSKLHLITEKPDKIDKDIWWRKLPNWWVAVDEAAAKKKSEDDEKKKKDDWWTSSTHNGKAFLPISNASDKVVVIV